MAAKDIADLGDRLVQGLAAAKGQNPAAQPTFQDITAALSSIKDLTALLKDVGSSLAPPQPPADPLAGLQHLKAVGLDAATVIEGQKGVAQLWQGFADAMRKEAEVSRQEAREAQDAAKQAEAKLLAATLERFADRVESLVKSMGEKPQGEPKPDPVTAALQQAAARMLSDKLAEALAGPSAGDSARGPVQQLQDAFALLRTLDGLVQERARVLGGGGAGASMTAREYIELEKVRGELKLAEMKYKQDVEKFDQLYKQRQDFLDVLRDGIAALVEAYTRRGEARGSAPAAHEVSSQAYAEV